MSTASKHKTMASSKCLHGEWPSGSSLPQPPVTFPMLLLLLIRIGDNAILFMSPTKSNQMFVASCAWVKDREEATLVATWSNPKVPQISISLALSLSLKILHWLWKDVFLLNNKFPCHVAHANLKKSINSHSGESSSILWLVPSYFQTKILQVASS